MSRNKNNEKFYNKDREDKRRIIGTVPKAQITTNSLKDSNK